MRVVNGKMADAGTTNWNVFIQLVGSKGSTGKLHLVGFLQHGGGWMDRGTYQDLIVETDSSLGEVQVVVLDLDSTLALDSTWYVQYTMVYDFSQSKPEVQFPCYHWITGKYAVTTTANTGELSPRTCLHLSRGRSRGLFYSSEETPPPLLPREQ